MTPKNAANPAKHRGGQPGNKNAKGNRGGGAPKNNRNACKPLPSPSEELLQDYPAPTIVDWINGNKDKIDAGLPILSYRPPELYSVFTGRTPEWSSEINVELHYGLYEYPPVFSPSEARMIASLRHVKGA